jgi:hypothetical protein
MSWNKAFSDPTKPTVTIMIQGKPVECDVMEEAQALVVGPIPEGSSGLKPSGRYWLRRRDTGHMVFPKKLPR